jgi:hypothetical protein
LHCPLSSNLAIGFLHIVLWVFVQAFSWHIFFACALFLCVVLFYLLTFCFCRCNFVNFVTLLTSMAASRACSLSMTNDDSDGGESLMHMVCPLTLEPPKLTMLRF